MTTPMPGTLVRIVDGPSKGDWALVDRVEGNTIHLGKPMLGRLIPITASPDQVKRLDPRLWMEERIRERWKRVGHRERVQWWEERTKLDPPDDPIEEWEAFEAAFPPSATDERVETSIEELRAKLEPLADASDKALVDWWSEQVKAIMDGIPLPDIQPGEVGKQRMEAALRAHRAAELQRRLRAFREEILPGPEAVEAAREKGREEAEAGRGPLTERIRRTHRLTLPDHVFTFWACWAGLTEPERKAWTRLLDITPFGILALLDEPDRIAERRAGIDDRLVGRYYYDPPEFLTLLHGGTDGLHYGLWYDDPDRPPDHVASYYNGDWFGIRNAGPTLLSAVRRRIVQVEESLRHEPDEEAAEKAKLWLNHLTDVIDGYEPAVIPDSKRSGTPVWREYVVKAKGTDPGRNARAAVERLKADDAEDLVAFALAACEEGQPAEALALGHDAFACSDRKPEREHLALKLLETAYAALGREPLAEIARIHTRHRQIPHVDRYE